MSSFFRALFDLSFSEFVTTKIMKILYVISIVFVVFTWVVILIGSIATSGQVRGAGAFIVIGALILCPIGFLVHLVIVRMGYEIVMVVFGIAENLRDMNWALTGGRKAPSANPPAPQYPQPGQYPQQPQYPPQQPQYPQYPQYPQQPQQPGAQQYPPQPKP